MTFHTVFSAEAGTVGAGWQADLLAYSFHRAGEPGPLTMLCAGGAPEIAGLETFEHPNYRVTDGDVYPPYNKPGGLIDWLAAGGPQCDNVLIVDPDCVWFGSTMDDWFKGVFHVERGRALAQTWEYHVGLRQFQNGVRHTGVVPCGIPLLMHVDDLRCVVPWWWDHTRWIRRTNTMHNPSWNAEMGGYMLAAAECGVEQQLIDIDRGPLLHYYAVRPCIAGWQKYGYHPWETMPVVGPPAKRALMELINERAARESA